MIPEQYRLWNKAEQVAELKGRGVRGYSKMNEDKRVDALVSSEPEGLELCGESTVEGENTLTCVFTKHEDGPHRDGTSGLWLPAEVNTDRDGNSGTADSGTGDNATTPPVVEPPVAPKPAKSKPKAKKKAKKAKKAAPKASDSDSDGKPPAKPPEPPEPPEPPFVPDHVIVIQRGSTTVGVNETTGRGRIVRVSKNDVYSNWMARELFKAAPHLVQPCDEHGKLLK